MQDITYLFLESISCYDTFNHLFDEMIKRNFICVRLIDDKIENSQEIIDSLIGKKLVLITTDHLANKLKTGHSIQDLIDILKPIKKYWGLHDVGCKYIKDQISNWSMLLPGKEWQLLAKPHSNVSFHVVGYQKFYNINFDKKYDKVFFPSLIEPYRKKSVYEWINDYKFFIDNNYLMKFPDYFGTLDLLERLNKEKIQLNLLDSNLNTFEIIAASNTVITNGKSSVGIEAAMLGCNSINIGKPYGPREIYDKFKVKIISEAAQVNKIAFDKTLSPMTEYIFDIDRAIKTVTSL